MRHALFLVGAAAKGLHLVLAAWLAAAFSKLWCGCRCLLALVPCMPLGMQTHQCPVAFQQHQCRAAECVISQCGACIIIVGQAGSSRHKQWKLGSAAQNRSCSRLQSCCTMPTRAAQDVSAARLTLETTKLQLQWALTSHWRRSAATFQP